MTNDQMKPTDGGRAPASPTTNNSPPTRRAVSSAAAASAAVAASSISAASAFDQTGTQVAADADRPLFELGRRFDAEWEAWLESDALSDEMQKRYEASKPSPPNDLAVQERDRRLFAGFFSDGLGEYFDNKQVAEFRKLFPVSPDTIALLPGWDPFRYPWAEANRRAESIVAAHVPWSAECAALWRDSGAKDAFDREDAADSAWWNTVEAIAATRATTIEGMALKARVVEVIAQKDGSDEIELMESIVSDLLRRPLLPYESVPPAGGVAA